jgi:uncharacterized protein (DUF1501 family)
MDRRAFVKAGATLGGAMSLGFGASMVSMGEAQGAAEDYRALVFFDMLGGNDGYNMVIPTDDARYAQYKALRTGLAFEKAQLATLNGSYGLHPSLAPLKQVWNDGGMALIHNVGILGRPTTKAQLAQWANQGLDTSYIPDGIGSHPAGGANWNTGGSNAGWMASGGASVPPPGWGAAALEQLGAARPVMSVAGSSIFANGAHTSALNFPGSPVSYGYGGFGLDRDKTRDLRFDKFKRMMSSPSSNKLVAAYGNTQLQALDMMQRLNPILSQSIGDAANPEMSAAFANDIGKPVQAQMFQIAKLIKNRATVGGNRHIFYCSFNLFDTHVNQLAQQEESFTQMGKAFAAFYNVMKTLGLGSNVTLATGSDFGRTYDPSGGYGTDHGWGNEHFVIGGAVSPQADIGVFPRLVLAGPDDLDTRGRWIPTTAVDQYAATLLKWFDPKIDLDLTFKNLKNFSDRDLKFMRA